MEAITAGDGTTHVSSADDRELYAGIVGAGCYVCKTGNQLKCTMQTANKAIIGTGAGFMYGTGFRNSSAEEVTIKSGTQAQRRNDIICVHFATDSAGNETAELAVLEGKSTTAAAATDPDIPAGNLLDGATEAWMPLWRIPLDGITVGEPVALFDILVPAAEVWDSVSQTNHARVGDVSFMRVGRVVMFDFAANKRYEAWTDTTIGKVPSDMFPAKYSCAPVVTQQSNKCAAMIGINTDGTVVFRIKGDNAMNGWGFCYGLYLTAQ